MPNAADDDACPYEWAEYNLPEEIRKGVLVVSPFARRVLQLPRTGDGPARERAANGSSGLASLLIPALGPRPLPKL